MTTLPPETVAEAFALSSARGADLLVRLGAFNVWRGDLATMRGDDPRATVETPEPEPEEDRMNRLFDTLTLARAIELLQPVCRAALATVYVEHKDAASLAADLDTDARSAQSIVTRCEARLLEIYHSLVEASPEDLARIAPLRALRL